MNPSGHGEGGSPVDPLNEEKYGRMINSTALHVRPFTNFSLMLMYVFSIIIQLNYSFLSSAITHYTGTEVGTGNGNLERYYTELFTLKCEDQQREGGGTSYNMPSGTEDSGI